MHFSNVIRKIYYIILCIIFAGNAQSLEEQLRGIFDEALEYELAGSVGFHGQHFKPSRNASSATIINTLNNFIGSSISSFPLSSTAAGLTFDFSSGRPVSTSSSLGPIFSERAQTIGKGLFNMGFNFTHINYTQIRGVDTEDLRLSFTHENRPPDTTWYGDSDFEFDYIDLLMNMDINATIFAFYFTYGITDYLDASVAVPFVNVSITSNPIAQINSYTYLTTGVAYHHFGSDSSQPVLTKNLEGIDDDATGVGDVAFRLKFNFQKSETVDLAAVLEYRLASGDETNFLGAGNDRFKLSVVASKIMGDFAPHINVSYELKNSDKQRDRLGLFVGYDQKISETLTLAIDFLGDFELGDEIKGLAFPDPITAVRPDTSYLRPYYSQTVTPTNLPDYSADHNINGAVGFKFNPRKSLTFIGNVFFPLNDAGLRSKFIPTFGAEFNF